MTLTLKAVHEYENATDVIEQCRRILNAEWPRSRALRTRSLEASNDQFPMTLALMTPSGVVLGTARLAKVTSEVEAVWIESVVLREDLRGLGIGRYLMLRVEDYAKARWRFKTAYLCTFDRQQFYAKIGYEFCDGDKICVYNGKLKPPPKVVSNPMTTNGVDIASSTAHSALPPPPPPPPPPIITNKASSDEELEEICKKAFKRLTLEDVSEPEIPSSLKPLRDEDEENAKKSLKGESVCRIALPKSFMKKILIL